MIMKVFSVFDAKAAFFGNPFFDQREGSAIRAFADAVNSNDPNNGFARHPEDYTLYLLGEFDNEKGTFDAQMPTGIVSAAALRSAYPVGEILNKNGEVKEPAVN